MLTQGLLLGATAMLCYAMLCYDMAAMQVFLFHFPFHLFLFFSPFSDSSSPSIIHSSPVIWEADRCL